MQKLWSNHTLSLSLSLSLFLSHPHMRTAIDKVGQVGKVEAQRRLHIGPLLAAQLRRIALHASPVNHRQQHHVITHVITHT